MAKNLTAESEVPDIKVSSPVQAEHRQGCHVDQPDDTAEYPLHAAGSDPPQQAGGH